RRCTLQGRNRETRIHSTCRKFSCLDPPAPGCRARCGIVYHRTTPRDKTTVASGGDDGTSGEAREIGDSPGRERPPMLVSARCAAGWFPRRRNGRFEKD